MNKAAKPDWAGAERVGEPSTDGSGDAVMLGLLEAVDSEARQSQRSLAANLNVALGLTNAYLRRCVRRGWIRVQQVPPNRLAYFLTPTGMSEKAKLAARLLSEAFRWYRAARDQYDSLIEETAALGRRRLALAGAGDLAEVALLCALRYDVEVVGVIDPAARTNRFRHVALAREAESLPQFDVLLLTEMHAPQQTYERLVAQVGADRVLAPRLLKVKSVAPEGTS